MGFDVKWMILQFISILKSYGPIYQLAEYLGLLNNFK